MKIIAKPPALYSVLKPETSSLSPSEKSNGVRLVSANLEINQTEKTKGFNRNIKKKDLLSKKLSNVISW